MTLFTCAELRRNKRGDRSLLRGARLLNQKQKHVCVHLMGSISVYRIIGLTGLTFCSWRRYMRLWGACSTPVLLDCKHTENGRLYTITALAHFVAQFEVPVARSLLRGARLLNQTRLCPFNGPCISLPYHRANGIDLLFSQTI